MLVAFGLILIAERLFRLFLSRRSTISAQRSKFMERTQRQLHWILSSAVVVGATITIALLGRHDDRPVRERLVSFGDFRPTPGRMARETSYRPWRPRERGEVFRSIAPPTLLKKSDTTLDSAALDLFVGNHARAIAGFELAAQDPATAVEALTDLSAAYLVRFEAESDIVDLLRAVHAADRGLAGQPGNPALLFNRAMALSLLGTRQLAARAWTAVQSTSDAWAQEAPARIRAAKQPSLDSEWVRILPSLRAGTASVADVANLTSRFPLQARVYGEETLLAQWAHEASAGNSTAAARSLKLVETIAETLHRERGEDLLADSVAAIHQVMNDGTRAERDALWTGLEAFGTGVAEYNRQNIRTAEPLLRRSADALAGSQHPLRHWARFYVAVIQYYTDADGALIVLDRLLREIPSDRYPALTGRIEWIAGTIDKVQGRIQSSVRRTEHAETALRRSGGDPAAAFVSVLLAEAYSAIGEYALAWDKRRVAFQQVPACDGPRRQIAMWTEAKEALLRQGNLELAAPLVDEAVADAELWGMPLGRAAAYVDRAGYRAAVNRIGAAFDDLYRARKAIAQMEPSGMRDQSANLALLAEGLCHRNNDPARSARLLQEALSRQAATGTRFHAIHHTTTLALAQLATGDVATGKASLERAISIFENIRATVEDPVSRMQAFRQAQPAFDRLIDLHSGSAPDSEAAFLLAERSRARVLLELRSGGRQVEFVGLTEAVRLVPPSVTLVSYVVLDEKIIAWIISNGESLQLTLPTRRETIETAIDRFRLELQLGNDPSALRVTGARLYDMLIRPLSLPQRRGDSLILIPDRYLARLPFAALFDRTNGEYLIQQRPVSIAPSVTLLLRGSRRQASHPDDDRVLAVGISNAAEYHGIDLPRLPHADREAAAVAALYERATLLRGTAATRENFAHLALSSDVIHFAGHAVVDLEAPGRSVLLFDHASHRAAASLSLGDLLKAGFGETRLVVLSACRAQDSLATDRDGLFGLAGAFVASGVAEVVASPLDVDDRSAAQLMVEFHRHRGDRSASEAFRNAVLHRLRSDPSGAGSPGMWGGFTVIQGSL